MKKVRLTRTQAVPKLAESPTKFATFASGQITVLALAGPKSRHLVQAELEASPAGGGGWAGAREACTAAPDGGRLSVVRCTEVMLTLRSWVGLSHVL